MIPSVSGFLDQEFEVEEGEELEDILTGYPKLTDAEKEELRAAITE